MMKRQLAWLLALVMLLAVGLPALASTPDEVKVQILATSDLHGWFMPWDFATDTASTRGSLTYLATVIKKQQQENPNTVLLDCGDTVQANYVEYFIDKPENPMIVAMNHLGYDAWTFGNHEYNFPIEQRDKLVQAFKGVALSGNVVMKDSGVPYLPGICVIERGGVRIGVIGLTTPLIEKFEKGKTTLDEVTVKNPLDVAGELIVQLKQQHQVDCLVGLVHAGLKQENDVKGSSTSDLAEAFPAFDVIISGHAHQAVEGETVNGVLLVEPSYYARSLSVIDLTFEKSAGGYRLTDKKSALLPAGDVEDPEMVALMQPYKDELSGFVNTPIGKLINEDLWGIDEVKGISAANIGSVGVMNLLSTAGIYYSKADCTLLNTDYEKPGFPVGDISVKNIASSYSFTGGEVSVYPITGKQLKTILEWSAGYFNQMKEGDLTISYTPERRASKYSSNFVGGGLSYTIDLREPQGQRIKNLALIEKDDLANPVKNADGSLKTSPITDESPVRLGTNGYYVDQWLAQGGCLEGQTMTATYNSFDDKGDDGTVRNLTIAYIRDVLKGTVDGSLYNYAAWGIETGVDKTSDVYKKAVELINAGKIELPVSDKGRTNIGPVTVEDVKKTAE